MIKFDIILPTTGRDSLGAAIKSVWEQSYRDWKLFIVCDGCPPILLPFDSEEHMRLVCVPNDRLPRNLPSHDDSGAWARNRGIQEGSNEWIAYIDDDDEWLPHHLATLADMITNHPDVSMLRTAGQSFKMKHRSPRSSKLVRKMGPVNDIDILTVGMCHTRDLFYKTRGWQPCDNHDHLLWREMLDTGAKAAISSEVTFHYRR